MQEGAVGTPLIALGSVLLANSLFRAQERYRMRGKRAKLEIPGQRHYPPELRMGHPEKKGLTATRQARSSRRRARSKSGNIG
jgi:hypothetical protein